MHFERVRVAPGTDEIRAGTVGDEGVFKNAAVRWDVLGEEERAWVVDVVARCARALGAAGEELELVREGAGYRAEGGGSWDTLASEQRAALDRELDDVLTAIHGLLVLG